MSGRTELADLAGTDLGSRTVTYSDVGPILYALAVGASADDLDLVYERDMRTLPTYSCALGLWAVEAAGAIGVYDPKRSLHASQRLIVTGDLPVAGAVEMTGRIAHVYDKGKAALLEIEVSASAFIATYQIFLPGMGGWGGERGPSAAAGEQPQFDRVAQHSTSLNLAALYRLTGDRHPVHIDPIVAQANGFDRPILHGLCTLGIAARLAAAHAEALPGHLSELDVRLSAPVLPGDEIDVLTSFVEGTVHFEARVADRVVLGAGRARFDRSDQT